MTVPVVDRSRGLSRACDGEVDNGLRDRVVGNCCLHISFRVMEDNQGGGVTNLL